MEYFGRTPSPPLDRFAERIWYCSDASTHTRERVIPGGGTLDLVVNLAEDEIRLYDPADARSERRRSGTIVIGTRTRAYLVDPRQRRSVLGVHFRPGGAFPFLGISPSEIVDDHVDLHDIWGVDGRHLREQLLEARSLNERFRLVEAALLRRLLRARPAHPAAGVAVQALSGGHPVRVLDVAASVGLSHRRFVEIFEREIGVTPKLYARLERFHRVKQHIARLDAPPSWAAFALASGYFDQSHMIREFVEFSDLSPETYLKCRTGEALFDHLVHAYRHEE